MKEKFNSEYLNKKLEPENKMLDLENTEVTDYKEFGDHSYDKESGSFEFKFGDTNIDFAYHQPKISELIENKFVGARLLSYHINQKDFKMKSNEELTNIMDAILDNLRVVDKFTLRNRGGEYDIKEIFDGKIFFNFKKELSESGLDPASGSIFLTKDPLTPEGLLILSHEVGHYKSNTRNSENDPVTHDYKEKIGSIFREIINLPINNLSADFEEAAASVLESERSAWAYALKHLRPFLKDLKLGNKDLEKYIHSFCLQSYSNAINSTFSKN
jgi:hypothetical protein